EGFPPEFPRVSAFYVVSSTPKPIYDKLVTTFKQVVTDPDVTKKFEKVGLVIIDEQHRFGVAQRATVLKKGAVPGHKPHLLTLTATPIPRTMALTLYGDLDLSLINELPPGRLQVKTWLVPEEKRVAAFTWLGQKLKANQQAFIICPLIEDSSSETLANVKSATAQLDLLQKGSLHQFKLALLHGRLKSAQKKKTLEEFRKGNIQALVATPVVEVGLDIPNATIMVIEAAQRFGLAQLHQLRGRVGRGNKQSFCLLFTNSFSPKTAKRLKAMEAYHQGNKLSEIDLKMRGPGETYGLKQHGFAQLKAASLSDTRLISETRQCAHSLIKRIDHFPNLKEKVIKATIKLVISS
ncbi:hypothetical protein MUP65_00860, partial [Patescibacteria group bacterium]|nr:hypothetical protein [Patescibacteria group bacterium]